jgi:hypothetical protein
MRWRRPSSEPRPARPKRKDVTRAAALAMLLAAALVVWLLIDDSGSGSDGSREGDGASFSTGYPTSPGAAAVVSVGSLRDEVAARSTPVYWAGPPSGSKLELSQPSAERTYVRYLTGDARAGDRRPFLTVGSYRVADPTAVLRREGGKAGGVLAKAPRGGTVYFSRESPKSVYLAYPGEDVEIEVFAPNFEQALQLVTSGRIVPVG